MRSQIGMYVWLYVLAGVWLRGMFFIIGPHTHIHTYNLSINQSINQSISVVLCYFFVTSEADALQMEVYKWYLQYTAQRKSEFINAVKNLFVDIDFSR